MDFLAGVNRVLREANIIRGDDDALTGFTGTAHSASQQLAQIAIQAEVSNVIALGIIPFERDAKTITLISGTSTYTLDTSFVNFLDSSPDLIKEDGSGNATDTRIFKWSGGEDDLRLQVPKYREESGPATHWYFNGSASKTIGLYKVPDASDNGAVYRYYFQKSVRVSLTSDTIPFVSEQEAEQFIVACTHRFKYLRSTRIEQKQLWPNGIEADRDHEGALATLQGLLRTTKPARAYGRKYF